MSGLLIAADPGRLTAAAGYLHGASGHLPDSSMPSLGDPSAEESMGHFARRLGQYHSGLCQAAGEGALLLQRYRGGFYRIGG